jgi:hypothetical protein
VLDVFIAPGDTTLYHLHNTPSVFITLTKAKTGSQLAGKQPQEGASLQSSIDYDSLAIPRLHRVWNEDTGWFHVMDVELTALKHQSNIPVLQNPFLKLLFNEKQVNGYTIELKPGSSLQLPASANGYLLVSKSETAIDYKINDGVQRRFMKTGHYIWIDAGKKSSISITNQLSASFVLLQLK